MTTEQIELMDGWMNFIILPSTSTQKNLQKTYNHYHCSAAPSAIEIGLASGQLHLQKNTRPSPPKKSTKNLQSLSLQRGAIRYRNWDRQRPAAPAKNTRAGGAFFEE
jgi:hypothetical protein